MPTIVEDFESGNLDAYAGTNNAKVQQDTVFAGSWALANTTGPVVNNTITSVTGLNAYPAAGDTFEFRFRQQEPFSSPNFHFGCQKALDQNEREDLYDLALRRLDGTTELRVYIGTERTTLISSPSGLSLENVWYRVQVDWGGNGDIAILMEDDSGTEVWSGATNDTTYTSGGIGFRLNGEDPDTAFFDDVVILDGPDDTISRTIRDDATGDTVSGARVIAISDNGDGIIAETQTSDTNGLVTFADLPSGTYALVAIDNSGNRIDAEYGVVIA